MWRARQKRGQGLAGAYSTMSRVWVPIEPVDPRRLIFFLKELPCSDRSTMSLELAGKFNVDHISTKELLFASGAISPEVGSSTEWSSALPLSNSH